MKLRIVAIRDSAANAFGMPNFVVSLGAAIRQFGDEVNRVAPDNVLNAHPEHFELFELGEYDDQNAKFVLLESPRSLAIAVDVVRNEVPKLRAVN